MAILLSCGSSCFKQVWKDVSHFQYILLAILITATTVASHEAHLEAQFSLNPCISKIKSGEIESASDYFHRSMCGTNLTQIVVTVFDQFEDPDHVLNVFKFIDLLESCEHSNLAKRVLIKELKVYKLTKTPEVLILAQANVNCTPPLSLRQEFRRIIIELTYEWGADIRNNQTEHILNFARKHPVNFLYYMNTILKQAYAGRLSSTESVLNFLISLPLTEQVVRGLKALYELVEDNLQLYTTEMLTFNYKVGSLPEVHDLELNKTLAEIKANLAPHCNLIINSWADRVNMNITYNVLEYSRRYPDVFRYHMDILIGKVYAGSLTNALFTMKFIQTLSSVEHNIVGFKSLLQEMTKSSHIETYQLTMLVYAVKIVTELPEYSNTTEKYKTMLEDLKHSFPQGITNIIWSSRNNCTIMNVHFKEYLYVASNWYDNLALLWIPGDYDVTGYWKLNLKNDGEQFTIQNIDRCRLLDAERESYDNERDYIGSWHLRYEDHEDTQWRILPNGKEVSMYSIKKSAYMYGSQILRNSERRYAFLWKQELFPDILTSTSKWEINCYD